MPERGNDGWTGEEAEEKYKVPRNSFGIWLAYMGCHLEMFERNFKQRTHRLRQKMSVWWDDEISRIPCHHPGLLHLPEMMEMMATTTVAVEAAAAETAAEDPHAEGTIKMTSDEAGNCPINGMTTTTQLCLPMADSSQDKPLEDEDEEVGSLTPDQ